MNYLWQVCDSIQRINFASLLPLEILGIAAGIWLLKNHRISKIWRILLLILGLMILLRMTGRISGGRYFLPVVTVMICFIPLTFQTIERMVLNPFWRNLSVAFLLCFGAGIAIGRACQPHPMPLLVAEFVQVLQKEYKTNPPEGEKVKFSGDTKREKQLLFYSDLPMVYEWMPVGHEKRTGAQYFREYGYMYNAPLLSQMDLYWLLKDSRPEDVQKTLEYMKQKHGFELVSQYHSQTSGNVVLYHLQRDIKDEK